MEVFCGTSFRSRSKEYRSRNEDNPQRDSQGRRPDSRPSRSILFQRFLFRLIPGPRLTRERLRSLLWAQLDLCAPLPRSFCQKLNHQGASKLSDQSDITAAIYGHDRSRGSLEQHIETASGYSNVSPISLAPPCSRSTSLLSTCEPTTSFKNTSNIL